MANIVNRICPYCGQKMIYDVYKIGNGKAPECICYCDNDDCKVKPCTDSTSPSKVYQEILAITGDKE